MLGASYADFHLLKMNKISDGCFILRRPASPVCPKPWQVHDLSLGSRHNTQSCCQSPGYCFKIQSAPIKVREHLENLVYINKAMDLASRCSS